MSNVVKIRKGNRILNVDESRLQSFLQQGYDQINEEGKVVKRATGGRNVSLAEFNAVVEELEAVKAQLVEGGNDNDEEKEALLKENKSLKAKVTKLEKELEAKQPDPNAK